MLITVHDAGSSRLASAADVQGVVEGLSDSAANALIDEASALIAAHCGRVLHQQDVTEVFRQIRSATLRPSRWPVTSVTSIDVDGVALGTGDWETDGPFLYRLSNDCRGIWRGTKITIRYTGGYAAIPADLKRACIDLCVNLDATSGRDSTVRSEMIPDVRSVSYRDVANGGGALSEPILRALAPYRELLV